MLQKVIYFDHAATTRLYPEVLHLLNEDFSIYFANPSSSHLLGKELSKKISDVKSALLNSLKSGEENEFYFTSSATESNNTVIAGLRLKAGDVVLYSKADHPSIVVPVENLGELGVELIAIKLLKNGAIDMSFLDNVLSEKKIALAIFSQVNHQSGNIYDVVKLASFIKQKSPECHVHVDAVQAYGKIVTRVTNDIDSMSITAHKLGGPKGIAGLYLKKNHRVKPLLLGGGQQNDFRAGTESFPLIDAFLEASKISLLNLNKNLELISSLNKKMQEILKTNIPKAQFPFEDVSPYILSFLIPGISTDIILRHLESKNVFIGTTSACSSRIKSFNPALAALGIPEKFHKNILRISFGPTSNQEDTEQFIHEFLATWNELRPFVK